MVPCTGVKYISQTVITHNRDQFLKVGLQILVLYGYFTHALKGRIFTSGNELIACKTYSLITPDLNSTVSLNYPHKLFYLKVLSH